MMFMLYPFLPVQPMPWRVTSNTCARELEKANPLLFPWIYYYCYCCYVAILYPCFNLHCALSSSSPVIFAARSLLFYQSLLFLPSPIYFLLSFFLFAFGNSVYKLSNEPLLPQLSKKERETKIQKKERNNMRENQGMKQTPRVAHLIAWITYGSRW